jgi:hypothetical protein
MNYSAFPFYLATLPDSYFSKEKTVKKKVKRAVVKTERENYKSRRVAAAKRRTLCVRTKRLTELDAAFVRFLWKIA